MSIRFEPCPVHEPTGVEYEKPCVFNDETGRWACAVCNAEGDFETLKETDKYSDKVVMPYSGGYYHVSHDRS